MKNTFVLLVAFLILSACAAPAEPLQENASSSSLSEVFTSSRVSESESNSSEISRYKESFFRGEIPVTWSYVAKGDVAPMPYHEGGWIEAENILYSFGQKSVAYGDTNWSQVDVAFMEGKELKRWLDHIKSDPAFTQFVAEWKQEVIDGRTVDIAVFATKPDGSITKGGTGGKMLFVPAKSDEKVEGDFNADMGVVISKQALGDEEFEQGFQHFMDTVDFDALDAFNYQGASQRSPR